VPWQSSWPSKPRKRSIARGRVRSDSPLEGAVTCELRDVIPDNARGTESLPTLCWRKADSKPRSPVYGELRCTRARKTRHTAPS
jgi:hypothetical protein